MSTLVLVRHGESLWNKKGIWTGLIDISLSPQGKIEAQQAGNLINGIHFDTVVISVLKRAKETFEEMKPFLKLSPDFSLMEDKALNERDYGDLTGKNKWDIEKKFGEKQFLLWRRSFDTPPPGGESLKDVYNRTVPYYQTNIYPFVKQGKNVLIIAHGNSLRALMKYLENVSDVDISKIEIPTGGVVVYQLNNEGIIEHKEIKISN